MADILTLEKIRSRYSIGYIRDEQLDGAGAAFGSAYETMNYVSRGIITQAEADNIRAACAPPVPLEQQKLLKVAESKTVLADYLETHPLEWTDGKRYSVTMDKQTLLMSALYTYQIALSSGQEPELRWNATGEECAVWAYEDLAALALGIAAYVEPLVSRQQALEVEIMAAASREELEGIAIDYTQTAPEETPVDPGEPETPPDDVPPVP